jgi:hypothetical protein
MREISKEWKDLPDSGRKVFREIAEKGIFV